LGKELTMAKQDLIQTARDMIGAFSSGDWDRMRQLMTADCVYREVGTQQTLQNPDQIIGAMAGWKQAMPDIKGTVTNAFASGNQVVLEVSWEGTHTGPLVGPAGTIPASGKVQVTLAAWIADFEGGKVKETRHYFDMLSFLQQVGAVPQ
jgi:steroid delta-isomerase-like uncharacterized protein